MKRNATQRMLAQEWKSHVRDWKRSKEEENSSIIIDLKIKIDQKENSIRSLIERMTDLESDLRYEVRLNESLKAQNQRLREQLEKTLKKVAQ